MRVSVSLLVLTASITGTACAARTGGPESAVAPAADTLQLDQVRSIAAAVGVTTLFERVSSPSRYLTDLIGLHALQPVPRGTVLADLVPRYADLIENDPHWLRLQFRNGPQVDFAYQTALYLEGNPLRVAYARIQLSRPETYPAEAEAFRSLLRNAKLEQKYLVRNPYYDAEVLARARMSDSAAITPVPVETDTAGFRRSSRAVLLIGETHGTSDAYDRVKEWVSSPDIDWLGIEMLSEDLQPTLTTFLNAKAESAAYRTAREQLLQYYAEAWNTRAMERTRDPADNPYFRLLELARQHGKTVFALDAPLLYTAFRFGEFPLGAATRDYIWSTNIKASGRGVVYGGSSHFLATRKPNFLTFLRERDPAVRFFRVP